MIEGECFCGAIRYKIDGELTNARACHCSRCRKAFSGASSAYAELSDPGSFTWVAGENNLQCYTSQEGWGLAFCKTCGTTLCGTHLGRVHGVTLGSVNGDPGVEITAHIFV
ncbi:MAG: GFA family protein, partial [Gammaproteobacteria bacterium]